MSEPRFPPNVRYFLAFRVFFNARFYYPVLAVFFVDLGLTLDQYAILNVAWAASIVAFELPLGAVSDRIGRRPLVVGAAGLMVVEMCVLAFAPTGNPTLLFALFLVNRVLSGLAEAAASGADEALAYDTLANEGRKRDWPRTLVLLQRLSAAGFLLAMLVGGAVYDTEFLNAAGHTLGLDLGLTPDVTVRFPVYLTLGMSLGALWSALRMTEPGEAGATERKIPGVRESFRAIAEAGRWIRTTRFVLAVILFSLALDSVVRLFLTLQSSYYRMIGIPAGWFGILGAAFAAMGFVTPGYAKRLLHRLPPAGNFAVMAAFTLTGLTGIALVRHWSGALFVVPLAIGWQFLTFFSSQYLNEATDSSRRATVLSFKSLAGNLAYGAVGILYAVLYRSTGDPGAAGDGALLAATLPWLPAALAAAALPSRGCGRSRRRRRRPGAPDRDRSEQAAGHLLHEDESIPRGVEHHPRPEAAGAIAEPPEDEPDQEVTREHDRGDVQDREHRGLQDERLAGAEDRGQAPLDHAAERELLEHGRVDADHEERGPERPSVLPEWLQVGDRSGADPPPEGEPRGDDDRHGDEDDRQHAEFGPTRPESPEEGKHTVAVGEHPREDDGGGNDLSEQVPSRRVGSAPHRQRGDGGRNQEQEQVEDEDALHLPPHPAALAADPDRFDLPSAPAAEARAGAGGRFAAGTEESGCVHRPSASAAARRGRGELLPRGPLLERRLDPADEGDDHEHLDQEPLHESRGVEHDADHLHHQEDGERGDDGREGVLARPEEQPEHDQREPVVRDEEEQDPLIERRPPLGDGLRGPLDGQQFRIRVPRQDGVRVVGIPLRDEAEDGAERREQDPHDEDPPRGAQDPLAATPLGETVGGPDPRGPLHAEARDRRRSVRALDRLSAGRTEGLSGQHGRSTGRAGGLRGHGLPPSWHPPKECSGAARAGQSGTGHQIDLVHDLVYIAHMITVNIHEAKSQLSQLLRRVASGEEVIIARAGKPIARIVPIDPPREPRVPGTAKGMIRIPDDFDAPLPEEILREFEG